MSAGIRVSEVVDRHLEILSEVDRYDVNSEGLKPTVQLLGERSQGEYKPDQVEEQLLYELDGREVKRLLNDPQDDGVKSPEDNPAVLLEKTMNSRRLQVGNRLRSVQEGDLGHIALYVGPSDRSSRGENSVSIYEVHSLEPLEDSEGLDILIQRRNLDGSLSKPGYR